MSEVMTPLPYRVVARRVETVDTVTLDVEPVGAGLGHWLPGQFTMVYAFGVGEIPISISGGDGPRIRHTVRAVGAVSRAVCATPIGGVLTLRGPYGRGWDLAGAAGADLLLLAGGIGLAPLRPVLTGGLAARDRYGRITVLIGARTPADLIYTHEFPAWRAAGAEVLVTVDRADAAWTGHLGVVTTLLDRASPRPDRVVAFACGPEAMMRFSALALAARGVPATAVRISLERNMKCGAALCGHCQLGPLLICRDGPVVSWDVAEPLLAVKEL